MTLKYSVFGAIYKEPPQLTTARSVLGVGRDTNEDEIKRVYRRYAMQWHPDKHEGKPTLEDATKRMALYSSAYELLTDTSKREEAEQRFMQALKQPFLIGNRIFCLGVLYGTRIYIPQGNVAINDPKRMLTGKTSTKSYIPETRYTVYGVRDSILESQIADLLYTFYSGENPEELEKGFHSRHSGGLDDLLWIKNNDIAVDHFLNRRFKQASWRMQEASNACPGNIILMYRHGVCLEAFAAELRPQKQEWRGLVKKAVQLYEICLTGLEGRKVVEEQDHFGEKRDILVEKPESQLTILMQLADAYVELGHPLKSRKLWAKVKEIDPNCYEAREKGRSILLAPLLTTGRAVGLLPKPK